MVEPRRAWARSLDVRVRHKRTCGCLQGGPDGESLAADVRHTWALQHDACAGRAVLRSLLWPGYMFVYQALPGQGVPIAWGGLYFGTGAKNNDLIFMV